MSSLPQCCLLSSLLAMALLVWIAATLVSNRHDEAHNITGMPSLASHRQLAASHPASMLGHPVSERYKFIFLYIPYTGGRRIAHSFLLDDAREAYGPSAPMPFMTLKVGMEDYHQDPENYQKLSMIRHPCGRFVKTFQTLHARYLNGGKGLSGAVNRLIARHPSLFDQVQTVSDFVMKLTLTDQWETLQKEFFHFASMSWYLFQNDGQIGVDGVICQESPKHGLDRLEESLSLNTTKERDQFQQLRLQLQESKDEDLCADLPVVTRQAIAQHYGLDMCVFGFDSTLAQTQCLGDTMTKEGFTARYHECQAKLAVQQQQKQDQWKANDYAYVKQIEGEPRDPNILDIPLQ